MSEVLSGANADFMLKRFGLGTIKVSIAIASGVQLRCQESLAMVVNEWKVAIYMTIAIVMWQWFSRLSPKSTGWQVRMVFVLTMLAIALGLWSEFFATRWFDGVIPAIAGTLAVMAMAKLIHGNVDTSEPQPESVRNQQNDSPFANSKQPLTLSACQEDWHRELAAKNLEFEAIFQAFPDLFLLLERDGTILEYRGTQHYNLHISPGAIGQQTIQELLPSPVASKYQQAITRAIEQQCIASISYSIDDETGQQMYEARLVPFKQQKIMMFIRNTTEQKQAEKACFQSYQELSDIKHALDRAAIVAFTDAKGIMTEVNDNFCQISGYSRQELIGKTDGMLKSDEHPPEFFVELWSTIASGKIWHGEIKNRAKDGSDYWMDTTIVPFLHERSRPVQYLSIGYDITDRKQAEAALHQQQERLSILHEIDRAILEAREPEAIASVAAKYLRELLPCQRVSAIEFNLNTLEAVMLAISSDREHYYLEGESLPEMNRDGFANPEKLGNGILEIEDLHQLEQLTPVQESLKAEGMRACMCVPLTAQDSLLGSLNIWLDRPGRFSEGQVAIAQEVADSLAISIQQARLCQTVQSYAVELEQKVAERTAELVQLNQQLRGEIQQRHEVEVELYEEKEFAQVTLHSIGDGVMTTDIYGTIQSLNPQAEILTGWLESDAQGQPLSEVLKLYNPSSRLPVENLLDDSASGVLCPLSQHTLIRHGDGEEFIVEHSVAPIRRGNGEVMGMVVVCRDVTEKHQLAAQLSWEASHDILTNLINRREFKRQLSELMEQKSKSEHSLCYLDLDQFKIVNDTCGHAAGDELLRQVTVLLESQIRKSDLLARLGGDEFAILFYECSAIEAQRVSEELRQAIQEFRFVWQDKTFCIGVSIGIVEIDPTIATLTDVMSCADAAMYAAKDAGRNRVHVYKASDRELAQRHGDMQWVSRLVKALEEDRFCLYSQAIAPVKPDGTKSYHYEILIRMTDENGAIVPPGMFIPAAERYNLMPRIDRWVIRHLFSYLSEQNNQSSLNIAQSNAAPQSIYTINLSGASFNDDKFLHFLQEQLVHYQILPQMLCFEVTETFAITNLNQAIAFINALKKLGCSFALDDFGSGMSSLTYLKNLPVDYVKIDGYFVKNILEDPVNAAMIEAINKLTHVLGLETIAEFVENERILDKLQELDIDYVQGYGIAKPTPLGGKLINLTAAKHKTIIPPQIPVVS